MKSLNTIKKALIVFIILYTLISGGIISFGQNLTSAGETVFNIAKASYEDDAGDKYDTVSQIVNFTVQAISSIVVTPDETQASKVVGPNEQIIREFDVCNTSNITDFYTLTQASVSSPAEITALYFDVDNSGDVSSGDIQISLNNTQSPNIAPGSCIKVLVLIDTKSITPTERLEVSINARSGNTSTANGAVEDSGRIINTAGKGAVFTNPNDPTLIPLKLVENQPTFTTGKNQPLDYLIAFRNSGEVEARDVVITDDFPEQIEYVPNTLRVNGNDVTDVRDADEGEVIDNRLVIRLNDPVQAGEEVRINFKAIVIKNDNPGQGIVNIANITSSNAQAVDTSQAIVVIDPFGTVYAARGGEGSPIPGATVTIITDQSLRTPLQIPQGNGFEPNFDNENPYLTNSQGRFSFALRPDQLGSLLMPATYFVTVTADGFRPRLIRISISPNGNGLFRMLVRSADGMPIAVADGFALTENEVEIASIADIAMNIPMFENSTLEINKTADRVQAEVGDLITYRIEIGNSSVAPLFDTVVRDTLPNSFNFVKDSARIERGGTRTKIEPEIIDNLLRFRVGRLGSGERITLIYRVRIGVNARQGDNYNSAVAAGRFTSGEIIQTDRSRALVRINQGVFSMRQVIIGRVYVDDNANNVFDKGEKPVAGARVYLANGNSAITDSQGMYNIPAVSSGAQVVAIDPITLPNGYVLTDNRSRSGKDWTRLLRTPLGGGGLLRQNFALVESSNPDINKNLEDKNFVKTKEVVSEDKANKEKEAKAPKKVYKKVAPGGVLVHSLKDKQVILSPAFNFDVSVAKDWKTEVLINGKVVSQQSIGTTRKDPKNKIVTYTFIGLGLKPGPNKFRVTAVGANGEKGESSEMILFGRGPVKRFRILPERKELQASGRDSTNIVIQAFDQWENPAQDGSISIQTSAGRFVSLEENVKKKEVLEKANSIVAAGAESSKGISAEQVNEVVQQEKINLVGGVGVIKLVSDNRVGAAKIEVVSGTTKAETDIRFVPEMRPRILVGLAEVTIGNAAPDMQNRQVDEDVRSHVQFFYRGSFFGDKNLLTLAYDSQQPLNRVNGQDRLFQLNPLDRTYPIFGDSSTQFQETESNSKVYARLDRGRNYAMFGDFDADMENSRLLSYGRRLTGVKLHLENDNDDFVSVTGARPDTSFARQVIPGGSLGLVQLAYSDILIGSDVLSLEVRDRRNPEIILSREVLTRSLDYNIDTSTGTIFFLRPIPTFDRDLNLIQIVATYEYRSNSFESTVYTARASKNFRRIGLRLGFSFVNQQQADSSPFNLGGLDASLDLPNKGKLDFEWAMSRGSLNTGFSFFGNNPNNNGEFNGNAFAVTLVQPLPFNQSVLRFDGVSASRGFYNPFGATVTPGNTRGALSVETQPVKNANVRVNLVGEKNETENVDNNRITAGVEWSQTINEKLHFNFGYDFRKYSDNLTERDIISNLISVGADIQPIDKLNISIKREQNLGEADPTFPNQTLISADYKVSSDAKVFFTQRLSSAAIAPISDVSGTGFGSSNARNETAIGVETQFGKFTSMSGRYQLENGINGTDSFAIIGLKNRLPIQKTLSLEVGYERAFHLAGEGESYNNVTLGANWLPSDSFRSSFRYEMRDRDGFGQLFSFGAAGQLKPGWTTLGRFQYGNIKFDGRQNRVTNGQIAMAIRPQDTDKYGLLFSYQHRNSFFANTETNDLPTKLRSDIISVDGFHQTTRRLELYGRFGLKFSADGNTDLPYASNLTYLMQGRAQYRLTRHFDVAGEGRYLYQPSSGSQKQWFGIEGGFWATPDVRIGGGYNFSLAKEPFGFKNDSVFNKKGFYFVLSTKVSNLFNLFGTSETGLKHKDDYETQERLRKLAKKRTKK